MNHTPRDCLEGARLTLHRRIPFLQIADGRLLFRLVALGLLGAGSFALVQSARAHILAHDLNYIGMDMVQLCGISRGKVTRFMLHDRVSFGGALISLGVLYLWLEQVPLKAGENWAWWTFLFSGFMGFGSFLAYLSFGYLDSWHAVATVVLLPLYVEGLALNRRWFYGRSGSNVEFPFSFLAGWRTQLGLGRGVLLMTSLGLIVGGTTILLIGMTRVFVPQDLSYLGLGASDLLAINRRLVPLIAHDRAGFGGAVATSGFLLFCCVWFGPASRSLWFSIVSAGSAGFVPAIGVHPFIGYTDFLHLVPAYFGAFLFCVGIALCHNSMCTPQTVQ